MRGLVAAWTAAPAARWRRLNAAIVVALVLFVLYYLGIRPESFSEAPRQVDFQYYYQVPPLLFQKLEYPTLIPEGWHARLSFWHTIWPYLPSAAAMMLPLNALPRSIAFGIWLALQAGCFFFVLLASMRLAGCAQWQSRWLIAAAAVLLLENPVGWDLRNHNTNLIYLALALAGISTPGPWLGGLLLALSCNLKLYSASLLAGLAWWRDYRRLFAMLAFTVLIALLPVLLVGVGGFATLMREWLATVLFSATEAGDALAHMSLRRSVATILNSDLASPAAWWTWRAIQALWVAAVVAYFAALPRPAAAEEGRARLADTCVLLLALPPLSTLFGPYHAVVLVPAFVLLLSVAVDESFSRGLRIAAIAPPLVYELLFFVMPSWEMRSLLFYLTFLMLLGAFALIRASGVERTQNAASAPVAAQG